MVMYQNMMIHFDIAGRAVINASENGSSFPLKKRDQLLDYTLTLMGRDDDEDLADSTLELLDTQVSNFLSTIVSGEIVFVRKNGVNFGKVKFLLGILGIYLICSNFLTDVFVSLNEEYAQHFFFFVILKIILPGPIHIYLELQYHCNSFKHDVETDYLLLLAVKYSSNNFRSMPQHKT